MEVTPHLKTVLKNYQHSATKSLHGPGLSLVNNDKCESLSPDSKEDDFLQHTPLPIQQLPPILTIADTSCSERTETILEGESISCFVVGGERRLCLPQVLNSVLRDFLLVQIHQECDQLQIYCSRCTPEQLNVLKSHGILPSTAPTCGLITKTDAERLCSALLHNQVTIPIRNIKGALSFRIYHECFGKCMGLCTPALYTSKDARCIECVECHGAFTPQQFVCHVHRNLENRTVHWGFDSSLWRSYMYICKDQIDHEQYAKYLDDMREQYEGKIPHPAPVIENGVNNLKRKQMPNSSREWLECARQFQYKWNFPNCIGALDGKHIVIQAPQNSGSHYFNYKGNHSIVLMASVDANYKFLYIDVGCNGRVSDGGVFTNCTLSKALEENRLDIPHARTLQGRTKQVPFVIVADDAFAMKPYIMKPYAYRNQPGPNRVFNYRLSRARRVVENAFGHIANRFRILRKPIDLCPAKVIKIISAICVLHNFLLTRSTKQIYAGSGSFDSECDEGVVVNGSWRQEGMPSGTLFPLQPLQAHNYGQYCKDIRTEFTEYFCTPIGEVPWQYRYI